MAVKSPRSPSRRRGSRGSELAGSSAPGVLEGSGASDRPGGARRVTGSPSTIADFSVLSPSVSAVPALPSAPPRGGSDPRYRFSMRQRPR